MTWFAFKNDGRVYDLNGIAEKQLAGTFAHGYGTMAQALAHPNDPADPFQASLLADFVMQATGHIGGGTLGVIQIVNVNAQGKVTGKVGPGSNPVSPGNLAADAFGGARQVLGISGVSGHNLLVRSVKIIVGAVLLLSGIVHLTGTDKEALGVAGKLVLPR